MSESVVVKSDLVNEINRTLGLNQREAKEFVDNFFEEIRCSLERHEEVKISGFGRFSVRHKRPRPGRNPKTGIDVTINERWVVTFRASNKLRQRVVNFRAPPSTGD